MRVRSAFRRLLRAPLAGTGVNLLMLARGVALGLTAYAVFDFPYLLSLSAIALAYVGLQVVRRRRALASA